MPNRYIDPPTIAVFQRVAREVRMWTLVWRGTAVGGLIASLATATVQAAPANWHDIKCARYSRAWEQALVHQGPAGLSRTFLSSHAAFLASNCTRRADVCARTPEELKLADTMVVLSMNAGTASTFPPFYCR